MKIKLFVMDVDGTLTDGRIYIGNEGEIMKAFDVKDGYGIRSLMNQGVVPVIITGRKSAIVAERCRELGIEELYQGVADKLECMMDVAGKYGVEQEQIAYIGDDMNDLACMQVAGISACPADAWEPVKESASYVCRNDGGRGAIREFADYLIHL